MAKCFKILRHNLIRDKLQTSQDFRAMPGHCIQMSTSNINKKRDHESVVLVGSIITLVIWLVEKIP